jgi:hypothetical protein
MSTPLHQLHLKICRTDPYFGFIINKDLELEIYEKIHKKGYKCLSQYTGSKIAMTVQCVNGHVWSGYPIKILIPCNNCQQCWKDRELEPVERLMEIIISKGGTILSPYISNKVKISVRCEYDHVFNMTPGHITQGGWCNICAGNNVEEAKNTFYSILSSNGAVAITPYVNSITHVVIRCKFGHEYPQVPGSTNMGYGCPYCAGNAVKLGNDNFQQALRSQNRTALSEYINNTVKLPITCQKYHIVFQSPHEVSSGSGCRKCSNKCPGQAEERFFATVFLQDGTVIGEYVNVHMKVEIRCKLGHLFEMTPGHISQGKWCRKCRNVCPVQAHERFVEVVNSQGGTIIGKYVNTSVKIALKCQREHYFEMKPNNVTNGKWCRSCGFYESKGEKIVREYLTNMNIVFNSEMIFDWMPLKRFDFYFVYNGRKFVIEFDGIQHFVRIDFFCPTEEIYNRRRQADINKTIACLNNGYYLIRICHSDIGNISTILDKFINDPQYRLSLSNIPEYTWLLENIKDKVL